LKQFTNELGLSFQMGAESCFQAVVAEEILKRLGNFVAGDILQNVAG
jgi:hypothetical protein